MSAPNAIGCWKNGDMNVLSTTSSTFLRLQISAIAAMSLSAIRGLVGVSTYTMRVFFWMARSTFFASDGATTIDPDGPGSIFETPTSMVPEDLAYIP